MPGYFAAFGPYEPEDDEDLPEFLREPDPLRDLEGYIHERTSDDGPVICAQAVCTKCGADGLHVAALWRMTRRGPRPVTTIDGAMCNVCKAPGALRARLVGPDGVG